MAEVPHSSPPDPDLLLIRNMARGDTDAAASLYNRHGRQILAYLLGQLSDRQMAEEVLQDVMLAAWNGASRFRGDSTVKTWLMAIARIKVMSVRRKRTVEQISIDESGDWLAWDGEGPSHIVERRENEQTLRQALHELPADQREVLELVFYQGLSGPEAAEVMGVAAGTIKSRVFRAKQMLRGILQRQEVKCE